MLDKKIHIGKLLLEQQLITQEQLDRAIGEQNTTGGKLGQVLIDLGFVSEESLLNLLSSQLNIPFVDLRTYALDPAVVHMLPEFHARHYRALVLNKESSDLLVGMVDPQDILAQDELTRILQSSIRIALIREMDLIKVIDAMYRHNTEISNLAEELSDELKKNDFDVTQLAVGLASSDAPVVKLLQTIFEDAVQVNASDVHIEPEEMHLTIRQRIDGVLHEQIIKEKHVAPALTLRLKLMAGLSITEKRLPQDGRFSIKIRKQNFDVRLSTMPVAFGESVVMRLLNQSAELLDLDRMGMPKDILATIRKTMTLPNGLFLVTGPTGAGKTTTLYSILSELNVPEKKIISVEDPVEYRLTRITQVQVMPRIDLTFARVLRSVLRQDPDIIMVGELRDEETVAIALRAAMTGHFVLSTLHTNDAASCAIRLIDMGAEGYLVASILRAIIAQRLVRRICQNCIKEHELTLQEKLWVEGILNYNYKAQKYYEGVGCTYCHNSGFKGQVGVYELLEINSNLAEMLRIRDTTHFVKAVKEDPKFKSLLYSGLDLVAAKVTSLQEIIYMIGEGWIDTIPPAPTKVAADANV